MEGSVQNGDQQTHAKPRPTRPSGAELARAFPNERGIRGAQREPRLTPVPGRWPEPRTPADALTELYCMVDPCPIAPRGPARK